MAPAKKTAVPSFYEADVKEIAEFFDENNDAPVEGAETDVPIENSSNVRRYKYTNNAWVYVAVFDPDSNQEVKEKKLRAPKVSEPVVAASGSGSTQPAAAAPAKEKKPRAPRKKKADAVPAIAPASDSGDSVATDATGKKPRKPRASNGLTSVLTAIEAAQYDRAKDLLQKLIAKYGDKPRRQKRAKGADASEDGSEFGEKKEKKRSEYNIFLSELLRKMSETHADITPKERMKLAMVEWRTHKETRAAQANQATEIAAA